MINQVYTVLSILNKDNREFFSYGIPIHMQNLSQMVIFEELFHKYEIF